MGSISMRRHVTSTCHKLGDEYLEPLEVMPPATSHYQSLHTNNTSARYGNPVSNNETDNGQEDELYLTIIP